MKRILKLSIMVCMLACLMGCAKKADVPEVVHVGSLKGPTTMGIVGMMDSDGYEFKMAVQGDELIAGLEKGELDIALIPANLASVYYKKSQQGISVIDINTLGVLYIVERGDAIKSVADLKGKTLYMTGKGTTPDYALQYLLKKNGVDREDVTVEFVAEASEVVSRMVNDEDAIGLLPQPFVTTAMMKDESIHEALDLTEEWKKVSDGSQMVTGVTVVRNEFLEKYPDAVAEFVKAHKDAVSKASESDEALDKTAQLIEAKDIVKAAVAKKAYAKCHIVSLTGAEMKTALKGYLAELYEIDPKAVGGELPGDAFYYNK